MTDTNQCEVEGCDRPIDADAEMVERKGGEFAATCEPCTNAWAAGAKVARRQSEIAGRRLRTDKEMLGTGRLNRTGGSGTITVPKSVVEYFDPGDDGLDMVWFRHGERVYAVPRSEVSGP